MINFLEMSDITSELKRQLLQTSDTYKEEIRDALKSAGESLGKNGVNALIITGALVTSYLLYRGLAGGSSKPKKKRKQVEGEGGAEEVQEQVYTMMDRMADKVLEQSLVFLLTLAKEKLEAYLNQSENEENSEPASGEA